MKKNIIGFLFVLLSMNPSFAQGLNVGDQAPDFEAPSTFGNVILSEFETKQNVVLALYYADFTPV